MVVIQKDPKGSRYQFSFKQTMCSIWIIERCRDDQKSQVKLCKTYLTVRFYSHFTSHSEKIQVFTRGFDLEDQIHTLNLLWGSSSSPTSALSPNGADVLSQRRAKNIPWYWGMKLLGSFGYGLFWTLWPIGFMYGIFTYMKTIKINQM